MATSIFSALYNIVMKLWELWQKMPVDIRSQAIDAASKMFTAFLEKRFNEYQSAKRAQNLESAPQ